MQATTCKFFTVLHAIIAKLFKFSIFTVKLNTLYCIVFIDKIKLVTIFDSKKIVFNKFVRLSIKELGPNISYL